MRKKGVGFHLANTAIVSVIFLVCSSSPFFSLFFFWLEVVSISINQTSAGLVNNHGSPKIVAFLVWALLALLTFS